MPGPDKPRRWRERPENRKPRMFPHILHADAFVFNDIVQKADGNQSPPSHEGTDRVKSCRLRPPWRRKLRKQDGRAVFRHNHRVWRFCSIHRKSRVAGRLTSFWIRRIGQLILRRAQLRGSSWPPQGFSAKRFRFSIAPPHWTVSLVPC